ncbi:AMP nucleosidase [Pelagibius sp. Alg239-R121]|uniref:AMP nucleosidase n=1 Tax=Pelagibius sp. Alg239-R121 TaxID=2993448 RepID=UPI0024A776E9|nr:AMP nucleosidase [Pelagibius sp. Alg239-R121]
MTIKNDKVPLISDLRPFDDPDAAWQRVDEIYRDNTHELRARFEAYQMGEEFAGRVRACYPYVQTRTTTAAKVDTRLSYGFLAGPGVHGTTLTRPDLFKDYLREQFRLLLKNHEAPLEVGISDTPIPLQFSFAEGIHIEGNLTPERYGNMGDVFDLPDLTVIDDSIVNGIYEVANDRPRPLSLFTGPRVDYSLHRLKHYTATSPEHFQNFVIFTNYQFYVEAFMAFCHELMTGENDDPRRSQYSAFVEPGDVITYNQAAGGSPAAAEQNGSPPPRLPQMPAYHLKCPDNRGITLINIGVGPSNAKTITDHVAVLRPHAWLMLGHCAGLRRAQKLGDYVLAHGYVRDDHVLDRDLPISVPIPALAEMQKALESAVAETTDLRDYDLKQVMRTGTVATIDDRNWELLEQTEIVKRLNQSRAIALDMESATIAANGFRFRVPYGTLLCVSDKPIHGEIKLPGMANSFYRRQVDQHLMIGIRAMEMLREFQPDRLHTRKLRSFAEAAFR